MAVFLKMGAIPQKGRLAAASSSASNFGCNESKNNPIIEKYSPPKNMSTRNIHHNK